VDLEFTWSEPVEALDSLEFEAAETVVLGLLPGGLRESRGRNNDALIDASVAALGYKGLDDLGPHRLRPVLALDGDDDLVMAFAKSEDDIVLPRLTRNPIEKSFRGFDCDVARLNIQHALQGGDQLLQCTAWPDQGFALVDVAHMPIETKIGAPTYFSQSFVEEGHLCFGPNSALAGLGS
jgi:hypothetical protein